MTHFLTKKADRSRKQRWLSASVIGTVALGAALFAGRAAQAQTNLLTNNPGFENSDGNWNYHGSYTQPGWDGYNDLYNAHYVAYGSVAGGTTTEGSRALHMDWAGSLSTAAGARPSASTGFYYELRYDLRTLQGNFPEDLLGTFSYLDFFDASGNKIKEVWGPDWKPQVQARGVAGWETVTVRGLAPAGTSSVGVRVRAPSGIYYNSSYDRTQNRHIEVDNFRLYKLTESVDQVAIRRAPRLVEPGKNATLKIHTGATTGRTLTVRLLDSSSAVKASSTLSVAEGRGLRVLNVAVPSDLPNGTYKWEIGLVPSGGSWSGALGVKTQSGVICDQTVALPSSGNEIGANSSRIVYMGRWDARNINQRWMQWYGSTVCVRFNGTSLSLHGGAGSNGFGGTSDSDIMAVIDGDESNVRTISIVGNDNVFSIASGLSDGVHTARIFKPTETNLQIRVDGFRFDAGRGLLTPEPLSSRKLEVFGDSVTSGGEAIPRYFGYAPTLGRELDTDTHIISKGGTGVASSFSGQATLLNYWNNMTHPDVFNASAGVKWDLASWKPDAVLIAIGHNDQFNDGAATFGARYADFRTAVRAAYPNAYIVAGNTSISAPIAHFQGAIEPLLAVDGKMSFVMQINQSDGMLYDHPDTQGHQSMVYGDAKRFSYAEVIEDKLGWGLSAPGSPATSTPTPTPAATPTPTPASGAPIGSTIGVWANNVTSFVSVRLDDAGALYPVKAVAGSIGAWERLRIDDAGSGYIALWSPSAERYVTVNNNDTRKPLIAAWATAGGIGDWERFTWEGRGGNKFALKSKATGLYVSCNANDGASMVSSWATSVGAWEEFNYDPQCLTGTYFDNADFTGVSKTRRDQTIDFLWGTNSPIAGISPNSYSVRWTGFIVPRYSESYTFYVKADDGVRLWINGTQVINKWVNGNAEYAGTPITLTKGQKYSIKLEYYQNIGTATCQLSWKSTSQLKQIVPDDATLPQ